MQSHRWLLLVILLISAALTLLLLTGTGLEAGSAFFTSVQSNTNNALNTRLLVAPSNLTANASGRDVQLGWTAGQDGNGYAVLGLANGNSSSCPSTGFSNLGSTASLTYTDTSRYTPQGSYYCYQVKTTYGSWTSATGNPIAAAQIGFVASTVQFTNATTGTVGTLEPGDKIVVNFNQAVNTATGPVSTDTVCAWGSNIELASTNTTGSCGSQAVLSGSYTGNGIAGRAITGLSFTPDVVIIKDIENDNSMIRTATMTGDNSKPLTGGTAFQTNRIQSIQDFGFTVGSDNDVNGSGRTYHWIAFKAAQGEMTLGSYAGNSVDNRSITGLGFQPDMVLIVAAQNVKAVFRPSSLAGDFSLQFDNANATANQIQALEANGFQVGTDDQVNKTGNTYHYIAWKKIAGKVNVGSYTGNAVDNRNITGVGFQPEYVIINDQAGGTSVHKPASTGASTDTSLFFTSNNANTNRIQALQADGFQVGTDNAVNKNNSVYYWVAFAQLIPAPSALLDLGRLTGGTVGGSNSRFNATYAWSNGNKTLTVTIGSRVVGGSNPTISASTWTFNPVTDTLKLQSNTGAYHICDTNAPAGNNCLPSTTTRP